jgi:hypothetical protein
MRGRFHDQGGLFSYLSPEARLPPRYPLRQIRELVRTVLKELSVISGKRYSSEGRPSIPPEQLLSALLLQDFYGTCWTNRTITAGWSSAAMSPQAFSQRSSLLSSSCSRNGRGCIRALASKGRKAANVRVYKSNYAPQSRLH